jgi:hypothetical protein
MNQGTDPLIHGIKENVLDRYNGMISNQQSRRKKGADSSSGPDSELVCLKALVTVAGWHSDVEDIKTMLQNIMVRLDRLEMGRTVSIKAPNDDVASKIQSRVSSIKQSEIRWIIVVHIPEILTL